MSSGLLVSKIMTPDGTILQSRHRHDYVSHVDRNGETHMLDGGLDYVRCSVNKVKPIDLSCYEDTPHRITREHFSWGTFGVDGDQPLKWILLKDMEEDHIKAVIRNQRLLDRVREMFKRELSWREESGK